MDQLDLLASPPADGWRSVDQPGLRLRHWPRWLASAGHVAEALQAEVPWKQDTITLWGQTHQLPRLTCWMGDPGCAYTYSGVTNPIEPWTPRLQQLRHQVEQAVGCRFNSLLLNLYRDGRDKLGWHADDEPELEPAAPIASLSLGHARTFQLRHRDRAADPVALELGHGDLLVMDPPTQQQWQHQVPQRLRVTEPRINLTFRVIRPEAVRNV